MTRTGPPDAIDDLGAAGADPKLARAVAGLAFRTVRPPAPTWPVPASSAVPVAAIGIAGAGGCRNGDRIDAVNESGGHARGQ